MSSAFLSFLESNWILEGTSWSHQIQLTKQGQVQHYPRLYPVRFRIYQGWEVPRRPVPEFDCLPQEKSFTCFNWNIHILICAFYWALLRRAYLTLHLLLCFLSDIYSQTPTPAFLRLITPALSSLLMRQELHSPNHLCVLSLDSLLYVGVVAVLESPELNPALHVCLISAE